MLCFIALSTNRSMLKEDSSSNLRESTIKSVHLLKLLVMMILLKLMVVKQLIELKPMVHQLLIQKLLVDSEVSKQSSRIRISICIIKLNPKVITTLITQSILDSYQWDLSHKKLVNVRLVEDLETNRTIWCKLANMEFILVKMLGNLLIQALLM